MPLQQEVESSRSNTRFSFSGKSPENFGFPEGTSSYEVEQTWQHDTCTARLVARTCARFGKAPIGAFEAKPCCASHLAFHSLSPHCGTVLPTQHPLYFNITIAWPLCLVPPGDFGISTSCCIRFKTSSGKRLVPFPNPYHPKRAETGSLRSKYPPPSHAAAGSTPNPYLLIRP